MRKVKNKGMCQCSYQKWYRQVKGKLVAETLLIVDERCSYHGELRTKIGITKQQKL